MNRHTKTALMVAPFLILGGYIASDFYIENQANEVKIFNMKPVGKCDVLNQQCILKSGDFEMNIYDNAGITQLNSTFPVDSATIFLVDNNGQANAYPLGMKDNPYYWQSETPLRSNLQYKQEKQILRIIAKIKGGQYIAQFQTNK